MTPIANLIGRFLPPRAVPIALALVYSFMLLGILLGFQIQASGIPYADQRDTANWTAPP